MDARRGQSDLPTGAREPGALIRETRETRDVSGKLLYEDHRRAGACQRKETLEGGRRHVLGARHDDHTIVASAAMKSAAGHRYVRGELAIRHKVKTVAVGPQGLRHAAN